MQEAPLRSAARGILLPALVVVIFGVGRALAAWHADSLAWLEAQRKGAAADWQVPPHVPPILFRPSAASGR